MKVLRMLAAWAIVAILAPQDGIAQSYTISYNTSTSKATVISSCCGTWEATPKGAWGILELITTAQGATRPPNATKHVVDFEMTSPNYFSINHGGHFAMFLRGDMYTATADPNYPYRGHGIVMGNVSSYASRTHPNGYACNATPGSPLMNISIEVAGPIAVAGGYVDNCVFGAETYGSGLVDNKKYRVNLVSEYYPNKFVTTYKIYSFQSNTWILDDVRARAYSYPQLPVDLGGFFFAEAFNRSNNWTLSLTNLNARWE